MTWTVVLPSGGISSGSSLAVLNGANRLAVELPSGEWEILQFRDAELIGQDRYRLGYLLRGHRGTEQCGYGKPRISWRRLQRAACEPRGQ